MVQRSSGLTTMTDVTFSDNHALEAVGGDSGALRNDGTLSLVNVTIANNVTDDPGGDGSGGMENTGTLTITNSDIVGNTGAARAPRAPGDWLALGAVHVVNSIISGNTNPDDAADNCSGAVTTTSHDIEKGLTCGFTGSGRSQRQPFPRCLGVQRRATRDRSIADRSPAINAGLNSSCPTDDERGYMRITASDPTCDIGAYEFGAGSVSPTSSAVPVPSTGAVVAGAVPGSIWALVLLIVGLGCVAAAVLWRRRETSAG